MTLSILSHQRLHSQGLAGTPFTDAGQVVRWLGAVQSQDYAAAKWAVGQRAGTLTDAAIEQSFAAGAILRTHVMRPTWHFVAPADIRWLLALTAPRVHAANAYHYRSLELDRALFDRSNATISKTLQGGCQLTRLELASALRGAGIDASDLRLVYLIVSAELDGVICSGARRGKQFTYALLDERVPAAKTLTRDEALAELTRRYFTSHGPATAADYMWWSGLTRLDVQTGLEMVKGELEQETLDGNTYWFAASALPAQSASHAVYLLPNYDEFVVGYTDRSAIYDASYAVNLDGRRNPLFQHTLLIDGRIAGTWRRTLKKNSVVLDLNPFTPLSDSIELALSKATHRYADFLGLTLGGI